MLALFPLGCLFTIQESFNLIRCLASGVHNFKVINTQSKSMSILLPKFKSNSKKTKLVTLLVLFADIWSQSTSKKE